MSNRKVNKSMKCIIPTFDPDDCREINTLAQQNIISASWLIRRFMRKFRERHVSNDFLGIPFTREVR